MLVLHAGVLLDIMATPVDLCVALQLSRIHLLALGGKHLSREDIELGYLIGADNSSTQPI